MRGWCQGRIYISPRRFFPLAFGETSHRMANVTGVFIPDGIDGEAVRHDILIDLGIEIGTSFGLLHGKVWQMGAMGHVFRRENILQCLDALTTVLQRNDFTTPSNAGVYAAGNCFGA